MKLFLTLTFLLSSLPLLAKDITLANITSDSNNELTQFKLTVNSKMQIDSFRLITSTTPEGPVERDAVFPVNEVLDGGVTLLEKKGRDILKLKSNGLNIQNGGKIVLDFLYNGVNGARKKLHLIIVKSGKSFLLHTEDGNPISQLRIIANHYPVIGRVGISKIVQGSN